jgi:segregation and condensation protein B
MIGDEVASSLAAQAAAWVPPWARRPDGDAVFEAQHPELTPDVASDDPTAPDLVSDEPAGPDVVSDEPVRDDAPLEPAVGVASDEPALEVEAVSPESQPDMDAEPAESDATRTATEEPAEIVALISDEELRGAIEAILLVVDEPVSDVVLAQVVEQPTDRISALLEELSHEYAAAERGFELRRAAGGWRLYTRPRFAPYVEKFVLDGQQVRLTQAALETLAVVAYKQPVTRARISAIRGVNCDGVVRTLVSRGLIEECGSEPDSGALLYRTTTLFLEKLGLDDLAQLPPLAPFLPDDVNAVADGTG